MSDNHPRRYAFIDVQNTEGTVHQILNFTIDWQKLYFYLKQNWNCNRIFFYSGIQLGNKERLKEFDLLRKVGYEMHIKPYHVYKSEGKTTQITCPKCKNIFKHTSRSDTRWKSNCDAELSVDATNLAEDGVEFLIFSGDGDFEYVIRNAVERGVKVYIVSNAKKLKISDRYSISRFSTKLRNLISEKRDRVIFKDINDWKMRIKR